MQSSEILKIGAGKSIYHCLEVLINIFFRKSPIAILVRAETLADELKTMYTFDNPSGKWNWDSRPPKIFTRQLGKDWKLVVSSSPPKD